MPQFVRISFREINIMQYVVGNNANLEPGVIFFTIHSSDITAVQQSSASYPGSWNNDSYHMMTVWI